MRDAAMRALVEAYPEAIERVQDDIVHFRDGRRLAFGVGGDKSAEARLAAPEIADMFAIPYPLETGAIPGADRDPGRARNALFFEHLYGDCRKADFAKSLVDVVWLPKKSGVRIKVSRRNGVADRLAAVSRELDDLPDAMTQFLAPPAGGFHCRAIAGTDRMSGHGYGIAVDIATRHAHYWRWPMPKAGAALTYRNAIPKEIVTIFEKHGFIWGGKWYHYDTMHFEFRPELLIAARLLQP
jgi:hypothetical protein